ncbi:MAG: chorismate synthase [Planctomycetota bacterium]
MQFFTAGESHGKGLIVLINNFPRGVKVNERLIYALLQRRQKLGGRGARSKKEEIKFDILSGVYQGKTTGAPVSIFIPNTIVSLEEIGSITTPRPGHIDLAGALKYLQTNSREFVERASARETAAKTVAGAFAMMLLDEFNISVLGYTKSIGDIELENVPQDFNTLKQNVWNSTYALPDDSKLSQIEKFIGELKDKGDTAGGTVIVMVKNAPPGLGNHTIPEERLDAQLAKNIFAIQAVKGLEIGNASASTRYPGSKVYGNIYLDPKSPFLFKHTQDWMGGIEGGLSTGEDIILKIYIKPVPTLLHPKRSINLETLKESKAHYESSDYCIVPAISVVCEAVTAFVIASAFLERFGKIDIKEIKENYSRYLADFMKCYKKLST